MNSIPDIDENYSFPRSKLEMHSLRVFHNLYQYFGFLGANNEWYQKGPPFQMALVSVVYFFLHITM